MPKRAKVIFWTILIILLGFLRDYLFFNINYVFRHMTKGSYNQARKEFWFLLEWDASDILALKWILTLVFFLLFGFLTWLIIHIAFKNKEYNKITLLSYLALIGISGVIYFIYALQGYPLEIYMVIRRIMGMAQSFMPLMFLFILFKFLPEITNQKK